MNENDKSSIPPEVLGVLNELTSQLSLIMSGLLDASRATSDVAALLQINNESRAIQVVLNQATHLQMAADDANLTEGISALKTQAEMLNDMEAQVKAIVKDVGIAASVIGGVAQALTLIAKL